MKKLFATMAFLPILLALLLAGCSVSDPEHSDELTGINNGAPYMALGNSLTAGYLDSGLIMSGQLGSYPLHIARQMGVDVTLGTGDFGQPYVASPGIGSSTPDDPANIAGVLHFDGEGITVLDETPLASVQSLLLAATQPTPYENLGVPGALLTDVMNAYSTATSYGAQVGSPNPFFDFINRASFLGNLTGDPGTEVLAEQPTMLRAGIAKGANLATLWIGNNDILGGATAGTPIVGVTVTDPTEFGTQYATTLLTLAGGLVQRNGLPSYIVVANIPSITDIPYFMPKAVFEAAFEAVSGVPWSMTAGYAEGNDDDGMMVTFPALGDAADYVSTGLPGGYTLTSAEVATVASVVTAYNQGIANAVGMVNATYPGTCALYDANAVMAGLPTAQKTHFLLLMPQVGNDVDTAAATTYFSLDGVHPNQKGYGLIANGFLETINDLMGTDYPMVDLDTLSWDPTYGQLDMPTTGMPRVSPEASAALRNMFR